MQGRCSRWSNGVPLVAAPCQLVMRNPAFWGLWIAGAAHFGALIQKMHYFDTFLSLFQVFYPAISLCTRSAVVDALYLRMSRAR